MKHYLLLRNNKQSGPHTFEDLLAMGLRAHDLIWVDGKSAAWRYPAEFPEFKEHAPAAPEQPFDRFFRKPSREQAALPADAPVSPLPVSQSPESDMEIPTLTRFMQEKEADKQKEADRIRFEFPDQGEESSAQKSDAGEPPTDPPRYVSVSLPAQDSEHPIVVIPQHFGAREPRSSMALGKPVAVLFPERDPMAPPKKPPPRREHPWLQYVALLVGILSFMGLGILIGVKWTREKMEAAERQRAASLRSDRSGSFQGGTETLNVPVVSDTVSAAKPLALDGKSSRRQKKDSNGIRPLLSGEIVHADVTKEMDPAVLQEEARKRRDSEEKDRVRTNITQIVGLKADKYKVGVFGGISDLDVTVSNGSGYPMDQVVVEVDYLLTSKKVYKTETLRFTDLGPHGSKTLTLPHTGRGVKAESRIVRIDSRELDLAWSRE